MSFKQKSSKLLFFKVVTASLCIILPSVSMSDDLKEDEAFRAIKILHSKLDIDSDGEVDDFESRNFLEHGSKNNNHNHKFNYLHKDGDRSISVNELWEAWKKSPVHNWTVHETIYWLVNHVELPEYSEVFQRNSIDGTYLPRLASDLQYISMLGIKDTSAKSRISIKAMDVVLFGPPKETSSTIRDAMLYSLILIAFILLHSTYYRLKDSQQRLQSVQSRYESLQKAEDQMSELQHELDRAVKAQEAVATEKKNLEDELAFHRQNSSSSTMKTSNSGSSGDISESINGASHQSDYIMQLKTEILKLKDELHLSNEAVASGKFRAPYALRTLLQTTYNFESQYFNDKKQSLEVKAAEVKKRNQKLQKKKSSFLGYYKMAHEDSLEEDINTIDEIKQAITKITQEIRDRTERWRNIEQICGCSLELTPLIKGCSVVSESNHIKFE